MKNLRDFFFGNPVKDLYKIWYRERYGSKGASGFDAEAAHGAKDFADWLASIYYETPQVN